MSSGLGGISFNSAPLVLNSAGNTQTPVGSGFTFDLPLSSVQWFTNQALNFTSANNQNIQGFMGNVLQQQNNIVSTALANNTLLNQEAQPILNNYMQMNAMTAQNLSNNFGGGGGLLGLFGL